MIRIVSRRERVEVWKGERGKSSDHPSAVTPAPNAWSAAGNRCRDSGAQSRRSPQDDRRAQLIRGATARRRQRAASRRSGTPRRTSRVPPWRRARHLHIDLVTSLSASFARAQPDSFSRGPEQRVRAGRLVPHDRVPAGSQGQTACARTAANTRSQQRSGSSVRPTAVSRAPSTIGRRELQIPARSSGRSRADRCSRISRTRDPERNTSWRRISGAIVRAEADRSACHAALSHAFPTARSRLAPPFHASWCGGACRANRSRCPWERA